MNITTLCFMEKYGKIIPKLSSDASLISLSEHYEILNYATCRLWGGGGRVAG